MINKPIFEPASAINRLYVFGAGGSGRETAWLAAQTLGDGVDLTFLVDDAAYAGEPVNGIPVRVVHDIVADNGASFVAAVGDSALRRRASAACLAKGLKPLTLVHPRVEASRIVSIGHGSLVCAGSVL